MENPEFLKIIEKINKKFQTGHKGATYVLPKDKTQKVTFRITGFDIPNSKIIVLLRKGLKQRELKLSADNFYKLLYQPELFEFGELYNL